MHKLLTNMAYKYPLEGRYAVNIMKCIRSVFTEEPIPESSEGISYWHQKEEERGEKRVFDIGTPAIHPIQMSCDNFRST